MVRLHYVLTAKSPVVNILKLRSRKTPAGGQTVGRLSLEGGGSRHGIYKSVCLLFCRFTNLCKYFESVNPQQSKQDPETIIVIIIILTKLSLVCKKILIKGGIDRPLKSSCTPSEFPPRWFWQILVERSQQLFTT